MTRRERHLELSELRLQVGQRFLRILQRQVIEYVGQGPGRTRRRHLVFRLLRDSIRPGRRQFLLKIAEVGFLHIVLLGREHEAGRARVRLKLLLLLLELDLQVLELFGKPLSGVFS